MTDSAPSEAAPPAVVSGALFPIVGLGASAGGLEAFNQLLGLIPPDTGMAFVVIQHLDPSHKSLLGEALARSTSMPVTQPVQDERLVPNHVYVIPSEADISLKNGHFVLVARAKTDPRPHLPVDFFFSALAAERRSRSIGVVLSGSASDGTQGLRAIKAEGGVTFVQDPTTAKFGGMPHSAIDAGVVDCALAIPPLAKELVRLSRHPYFAGSAEPDAALAPPPPASDTVPPKDGARGASDGPHRESATVNRIMSLVRSVAGVDFREYKFPTFERRLARRMVLRRVESEESYLALLESETEEVRSLYEDTLIHVSSFFRDPEVFENLKAAVFPEILRNKGEGAPIRIWSAGCSSGEEVYSLAIALLDASRDLPDRHPIQIFGTDLSERSIQKARAGRYADGAMRGLSEDQRRRYFTKIDTGYLVNKTIRDLCVFVRHDLARDPPFSKLDLVSCRNVLIYFDQGLQRRVLPIFHYSLNQPGFLLLGRTEHTSGFAQLFSPLNETTKIFVRSAVPSALSFVPRTEAPPSSAVDLVTRAGALPRRRADVARHLDALMLARYAPPGVLVNEKLEIVQFRGQTGSYLQPAPGQPQNNIIKMARGGLRAKLQETLTRAKAEMAPVRTDGVKVDQDGFSRTCDIVVFPFAGMPDVQERLFMVLFEASPDASQSAGHSGLSIHRGRRDSDSDSDSDSAESDAIRIPKLEHELSAASEYLQSLIEEHSRTNDDLGSANEELLSGNEELQSLNEELETAKEELQSTNEELTTVNDELHARNIEVGVINSDLTNLLDTVDIPIVILDRKQYIRRFTPKAFDLLNLVPTDVGRLFDDIKPKIVVPDLARRIAQVIRTSAAHETEVQDRQGRWYRMQIRPYTAADRSVDGAVLSLFDISVLKHHLTKAQEAQQHAEKADRAKDEFLAVLSHELRTPLSALLMQAQLLRQVGADPQKRERACAAIERSTKMQVQLIDDLLDVSRIVTGKMRVELQLIDFRQVVQAALDGVDSMAKVRSVAVRAVLPSTMPPISGDRVRLEQVVSNLLVNAIKFTPSGGHVDVVIENDHGHAHLMVRDNGMGIEADFLPRIFNRLTQRDSSSTRTHAGLGLGLAIVHHLVEAHGGTVTAESPGLGMGATFHVNLPHMGTLAATAGAEYCEPEPSVDTAIRRLAGLRVLVVEDDPDIREALEEMLTQSGAAVRTAESAALGLIAFRQFEPHALLCDIAMPVEDGYVFIRKIRALGAAGRGDTPAMALTALTGEMHRRRALSEGFQMLITKPVDLGALAGAVAGLIEGGWTLSPGKRLQGFLPPVC